MYMDYTQKKKDETKHKDRCSECRFSPGKGKGIF